MTFDKTHVAVRVCALAGVLAVSSPLRAEDAMKETARVLYDEAREARQSQAFDTCRAKATAALAIHRHPKIDGVLGDCALSLGMHAEAARHLERALDSPDAGDGLREHLTPLLAEAVTHLSVVTVQPDVDGCSLSLDGAEPEPIAGPLYLPPGAHIIIVSKEGHQPQTLQIEAVNGDRQTLAIGMPPVKVPVNGDTAPAEEPIPLWPFAIGTGALAAVGIGVGVAGLVVASGAGDDVTALGQSLGADNACSGASPPADCAALADAQSDRDFFTNMAITAFIGGGIAAAATVALVIVDVTREPAADVSVQFVPTPFGGALVGSF